MITHTSGGDPIPAGCEIGIFTPETDEYTHSITHSLGECPKIAAVIGVINGSVTDYEKGMITLEYLGINLETGDYSNDYTGGKKLNSVSQVNGTTGKEWQGTNTYTTYPASMDSQQVTFATGRYYSGKFKAGKKYVYILMK